MLANLQVFSKGLYKWTTPCLLHVLCPDMTWMLPPEYSGNYGLIITSEMAMY